IGTTGQPIRVTGRFEPDGLSPPIKRGTEPHPNPFNERRFAPLPFGTQGSGAIFSSGPLGAGDRPPPTTPASGSHHETFGRLCFSFSITFLKSRVLSQSLYRMASSKRRSRTELEFG